jgi:hypothetical protein
LCPGIPPIAGGAYHYLLLYIYTYLEHKNKLLPQPTSFHTMSPPSVPLFIAAMLVYADWLELRREEVLRQARQARAHRREVLRQRRRRGPYTRPDRWSPSPE